MIFRKTEEEYFCAMGWTGFLQNCPTSKSIVRSFGDKVLLTKSFWASSTTQDCSDAILVG
jgi:hypothetical protein